MKKVYKYKIQPDAKDMGMFRIDVPNVPHGARFLHVGVQGDDVCIWLEVDPENRTTTYTLWSVGTGWGTVEPFREYLGSVQQGQYVWHLYA